jgi:hypothetical protein
VLGEVEFMVVLSPALVFSAGHDGPGSLLLSRWGSFYRRPSGVGVVGVSHLRYVIAFLNPSVYIKQTSRKRFHRF